MNLFREQPRTKNWTIHIQKEWKILEKNLPGKFIPYSFYKIDCNIHI
jgi:hypothetical protein